MDGKDEGVYAWVTANYLLGNIGGKEKLPTAAVFDLEVDLLKLCLNQITKLMKFQLMVRPSIISHLVTINTPYTNSVIWVMD